MEKVKKKKDLRATAKLAGIAVSLLLIGFFLGRTSAYPQFDRLVALDDGGFAACKAIIVTSTDTMHAITTNDLTKAGYYLKTLDDEIAVFQHILHQRSGIIGSQHGTDPLPTATPQQAI